MKGFKVVSFGDIGNGKSTFSRRMVFDLKTAVQKEIGYQPGEGTRADWNTFRDSQEDGSSVGSAQVAHQYVYTNHGRIHLLEAPGAIEHFGNTLGAVLAADHVNLVVDATDPKYERLYFYLRLALKLCVGRVAVLVNKMDGIDWGESLFTELVNKIRASVAEEDQLRLACIPICAPLGDNVFYQSTNLDWYSGDTVYQMWKRSFLSHGRVVKKTNAIVALQQAQAFKNKWAVQGQIMQGRISAGDSLTLLPSRERIQVEELFLYDEKVQSAEAGSGVTCIIDKPVDGAFLCSDPLDLHVANRLTSRMLLWGDEFVPGNSYLLKYFGKTYECKIAGLHAQDRVLSQLKDCLVDLEISAPLTYQRMEQNKKLGTFSVLHPQTMGALALGLF